MIKRAKNIVGKGENGSFQNFLPRCFQKRSFPDMLSTTESLVKVEEIVTSK